MTPPTNHHPGRWQVIPASIIVALFLNLVPFPDFVGFARPDFVTLTLFYWCIATPARIGVGWSWLTGLTLDLMQYTLFGQQAVGKAFIALFAVGAHRRLRLYHPLRQCLVVLVIAVLDIAVVVWIQHLAHGTEIRAEYWLEAPATALLWLPVYAILRRVRQRSGMVRR